MANQSSKYKKFIVGAASAALVASAVAPVVSAASFSDTEGNTHEEAINALTEAGIIKGYEDGTFKPNKTLKRSDVVKLMGKWLVAEGNEIPEDARTNPRFADLQPTSDAELLDYAAVVKDNHVFKGKEDGTLDAAGNITRENMAMVLVRAFDQVHGIDLGLYVAAQNFDKDVIDLAKAKAEARPAIDVLDYFDITNPIAPNFNPKNTTTRGHFATFLHKTINTDFSAVKGVDADLVAAANQVKDGAVEVLRGENATNETKLAAVQAYVNGLITKDSVVATVAAGKTANDYVVTLTKGEEKLEKTISVTFELTAKDLFVTTVNTISTTGVEVTFKATAADNSEANVVVKDGAGKVVPTTAKLVAEGATATTIKFVTPFDANHKFTGVWTVNGVAYSFDAINQLNAIVKAANEGNQVALLAALKAAGITVADEAKIGNYLTAIKAGNPDSLAAVQELITKIDEEATNAVTNAAKVKAVVDAKTQLQLLEALKANFKLVNADWIVEYAAKNGLLALDGVYTITVGEIQNAIYAVNASEIAKASDTSTSVEQAKVSALIAAWMKADGKGETLKAEAVHASKVKEAAFKVAEANTATVLHNALTAYANLVADEKVPATLKVADLNANLKEFYFAKLDKGTLVPAIQAGTANLKKTIVEAADKAAVVDAMTTIKTAYEAINTAEATTEKSTAAQKNALKTALQKLATATSHKADAAKFDASIVIDQNLIAYAAQFAKATAINANSTVAAVVTDINAVHKAVEVAAGIVSTEAELTAAITAANASDKLETITLKNNIEVGTETLTLTSGVTIEGNNHTIFVGGTTADTGNDKTLGLFIPSNAKDVVVKNLTIVGTHGDNLIEIYGNATLDNVSALNGKKTGIYVNNTGTGTITVNFKNITTASNGWKAGIGIASQQNGSKVVANFTGTHSFGEETAVYTDDINKYKGNYEINGLTGYTKTLVGSQYKWTKTK